MRLGLGEGARERRPGNEGTILSHGMELRRQSLNGYHPGSTKKEEPEETGSGEGGLFHAREGEHT